MKKKKLNRFSIEAKVSKIVKNLTFETVLKYFNYYVLYQ